MSVEREPIGVIGVGYVGLVTATCFAALGFDVVCRDIDPVKIATLQAGEVPIHEPGLEELLAAHRGRLTFTLDLGELFERARVAFVCVDTPPTVSGDADLSRVNAVIEAIPPTATGAVLVMKSTVPVGTGNRIRAELDARGLDEIGYVSNPEFLREGTAIRDFQHPDRVVVGSEREGDGDRVAALYDGFECPILRTDLASAEMVKLASNAFLATKISFINEIANVCEEVGADVTEVARGMGLDPRIGDKFLQPGVGYGGSCLAGEETVLVRRDGEVRLASLGALFEELADDAPAASIAAGCIEPDGLEVLAWDEDGCGFRSVAAATRRPYVGDVVEVAAGVRSVRATLDHPFVVRTADGVRTVLASELRGGDELPSVEPSAYAEAIGAGDRSRGRESSALLAQVRVPAGWTAVTGVERAPFAGPVYSLEVPGTHTFVTTGGLVTHNCFPKDVAALKQLAGNSGYHFQLLASVIEVNELQKRRVVNKLQRHLGPLRGKRVALLGLAFKPNTDDMREAASLVLAGRLVAEGVSVVAYDPIAADKARPLLDPRVELASTMREALVDADAAVIVTEWEEFRAILDPTARDLMRRPFLIDGRNLVDPVAAAAAGFDYESVGRPAPDRAPAVRA